ncbi:MCE family protein [Mycolicibacterium mucogenicum]|uniref:MCE family protein n=2 Tax=Mycolicibacterium mucogenicum DSM 44124 TaxID=1226753 RepID=A0A8E4RAK1_MYCMU|nr:MCE family protein [Mycolicibacterium mucogenicum]KAB7754018.1 virulence factor Mce [Mycolicibacterium mucogenicum DSM 44124]QPG70796.1 MCE family protein [Mycolicibacterium mucogenicum DSM 44124]
MSTVKSAGAQYRSRWERTAKAALATGVAIMLTTTGCAFQGVNSLPLPGAVGRGTGSTVYHVEVANVATLEPNSPVMINDVVVGSVRRMTAKNWHADIEFSVKPGVTVPANVVARVGQTSLLGSMHLALDPPVGQNPSGALAPGATIPLNDSSTYPTTERTLSSLAAVVNGGGLGQIGDVIHNFSSALNGHEAEFRDLLSRLNDFVGTLDDQRDAIVNSIQALNRLAATFAGQRDVLTQALNKIPPALDVLIKQRPQLTTALTKLGKFSNVATELVNDSKADLVSNLKNITPALAAFTALGPDVDTVLEYLPHFPFTGSFIDRAIRGDYYNLYAVIDLTIPRLKHSTMLGTRWGQEGTQLVPAPGDPSYLNYTYDPLKTGIDPPPPGSWVPSSPQPPWAPPPAVAESPGPMLPLVPQAGMAGSVVRDAPPTAPNQLFAGPYGAQAPEPAPAPPNGGN